MRVFTKQFEQAIKILKMMEGGKRVSVKAVQDYGLSRAYTVLLMKELINKGLASAKEGKGGGYTLHESPQMTIAKLIKGNNTIRIDKL